MTPGVPASRRAFVKATAAATVAVASGFAASRDRPFASAELNRATAHELIDVNVTLARWPFRRLPLDNASALASRLRRNGVTQAWAGTFDGLFHKDLAGANARLAESCRQYGHGVLVPFGSINLKLAGWEDDLNRCVDRHKMPGVRLHPGYHGYTLTDPAFARLLALAGKRRLIVQIVGELEDERTVHPRAAAPRVDCRALPELIEQFPETRIMLLNWTRSVTPPLVQQLATAGVWVDIAMVEGVGGVANLLARVPHPQVVFGSHAPFFYFEAALLKLKESALSEADLAAVRAGNAPRLRAA